MSESEIVSEARSQCAVEQKLRESAEQYKSLVEGSFDGIFIRQGKRIAFANGRLYEMLGYDREELGRLDRWDIYHPEDREIVENRTVARLRNEHVPPRYDVRLVRKNGTTFPAELDARLGSFLGEPAIQVCVRDISERTRAEEERLRLVAAIDQAAEIIVIADRIGTIRYANPSFETVTGQSRERIVGQNARLLSQDHADELMCKMIGETLARAEVWSGRVRSTVTDELVLEIEGTISPVRDSQGEITSYVAVLRDVTHEVVLQNQLRQAQKMQALGRLARGVAHDFNNILWAIMGFAEMLMDVVENTPAAVQARSMLQKILEASERGKDLAGQILTFSRPDNATRESVDVGPVVSQAVDLVRATTPAGVTLEKSIDPDLHRILGDKGQIHQVLMNLIVNGVHATRDKGGKLHIEAVNVDISGNIAEPVVDLKPGSYVRIRVRDTGQGMDVATLERVFEPYFTTKTPGEGTGLGLSVAHGIVKSHDGAIVVQSNVGEGSTFDVYLPGAEDVSPRD